MDDIGVWFGYLGEVEVGKSVFVALLPMTMVEFFDNVVSFLRLVFDCKDILLGDPVDVVHNVACFW